MVCEQMVGCPCSLCAEARRQNAANSAINLNSGATAGGEIKDPESAARIADRVRRARQERTKSYTP